MSDGFHLFMQHTMRHRSMITDIGNIWDDVNDDFGLCVKHYSKLLVTKLNFHEKNPWVPGNIFLERGAIDKLAGNDINVYYDLANDIFDYLDDILTLKTAVFHLISKSGLSSMTLAGHSRLQPLIPCI